MKKVAHHVVKFRIRIMKQGSLHMQVRRYRRRYVRSYEAYYLRRLQKPTRASRQICWVARAGRLVWTARALDRLLMRCPAPKHGGHHHQ